MPPQAGPPLPGYTVSDDADGSGNKGDAWKTPTPKAGAVGRTVQQVELHTNLEPQSTNEFGVAKAHGAAG